MTAATPIVVVTGPPAGGKSTVAGALADALALPLIAKDELKELLFDVLGAADVEAARRLGAAVYPLLYHAVELELRAGRSCILEANFDHAAATETLAALQARRPFRAFQVVCTADADVLVARYLARAGSRHAGHHDEARLEEVRESIERRRYRALRLDGETVELDTTDWDAVDLDALVERVRAWL